MGDRRSIRVLVVEDDPVMVSMFRTLLEHEGYEHITVVETGERALEHAAASDVVLLDYELPDCTGIELLPRLLAHPEPPSVIMITGAGSEELAASALRLGAEDYLVKGPELLDSLPALIERARRNRLLRSTKAEVERDLVRAERLAAIGEMTVTLHHELNNPLMAASAELDLLATRESLDAEVLRAVGVMRDALRRMGDILKQARNLHNADSIEYLQNLSMISLSSVGDGMAVHRGRAVICVPSRELARMTALLLRHAGFSVERVDSVSEAEVEAERLDTTLLVLSVPGHDPDPLQGFTVRAGRPYALVVLVPGDPSAARRSGADLVLTLPFDPAGFAAEVLSTITHREAHR